MSYDNAMALAWLLAALFVLGQVINLFMTIWGRMRPKTPCELGTLRHNKLEERVARCEAEQEKRYVEINSRFERGNRAMEHIRKQIDEGLAAMGRKSEESDRRINQRINELSELTHEMRGVVNALKEKGGNNGNRE